MTNQTAHPSSGKPAQSAGGSPRAAGAPPRKRRSSSLLLALVLLIAAIFAIVLLSPDQWREIVAPITGSQTPSATIAVAPAPGSPPAASRPADAPPAPATPRPPASSSVSPPPTPPSASPSPAAPPSAAFNAGAVNTEVQNLRALLADVTGRLGDLERTTAATRAADLETRLNGIDARIAALIEQPVVTPGALADALNENRQASQAAAQEAAETAAQAAALDAASAAADQAAQKAAQEATKAAERAVQDAVQKATAAQKDMAPAVADLEKRLTSLEKMAPAVVAIADIERRLTTMEKMAPAVAAIADQERRLAALEKTAASASSLAELDRRLAAVEKTTGPLAAVSRSALQGEALALGLLNLRLALDRGAPYADVLSALRIAAVSDPVLIGEVDRMAPAAASGAPTVATLRQRLLTLPVIEEPKPVAAAPSATSDAPAESTGFWADIWGRFASIVTVRRLDANAQATGPSPSSATAMGTTMGKAIERASARLAADDLPGAIGVLDDDATRRNLSATQQTMLDDWLREARARHIAETGFATLSRRSLALFSAKADFPLSPAPVPTPPPASSTPGAPPATAPSNTAPPDAVPPDAAPQGSDAATPGDLSPGL